MPKHDRLQEEQDTDLCLCFLREVLLDENETTKNADRFKAVEIILKHYQQLSAQQPTEKAPRLPLMPTFGTEPNH